jgi:hypothetical protein
MKAGIRGHAVVLLAGILVTSAAHGLATAEPAASSPHVRILKPPDFWGEYAIWGATGADRSGHIFFGMTSNDKSGSGSYFLQVFWSMGR